jgi:hypothetical protein
MHDFWRVGAIEDVELYNSEFSSLQTKWPECVLVAVFVVRTMAVIVAVVVATVIDLD